MVQVPSSIPPRVIKMCLWAESTEDIAIILRYEGIVANHVHVKQLFDWVSAVVESMDFSNRILASR